MYLAMNTFISYITLKDATLTRGLIELKNKSLFPFTSLELSCPIDQKLINLTAINLKIALQLSILSQDLPHVSSVLLLLTFQLKKGNIYYSLLHVLGST